MAFLFQPFMAENPAAALAENQRPAGRKDLLAGKTCWQERPAGRKDLLA
jgi:hypothetical protein